MGKHDASVSKLAIVLWTKRDQQRLSWASQNLTREQSAESLPQRGIQKQSRKQSQGLTFSAGGKLKAIKQRKQKKEKKKRKATVRETLDARNSILLHMFIHPHLNVLSGLWQWCFIACCIDAKLYLLLNHGFWFFFFLVSVIKSSKKEKKKKENVNVSKCC